MSKFHWNRTIITITVMIITVIEILDMTIVNVALPHMMGSFGANTDQITWVLTSYIVASAIVMPLTGFLVTRFGRKKLLMTCISGFLLTSIFSGASTSLIQIVFFRTFQGLFGASFVPLSQYILNDTYPPEQRSKAMAIWGVGVMVAPILGPTLGGYITELMNWRWIFYLNVPVCLIALILTLQFITETKTEKKPMDWIGLSLLITGIGCLQIFLDRGNSNDWLQSQGMLYLLVIWIFTLTTFVIRGITNPDNIINLSVFKDRNFSTATFMLTIFGAALFGIIAMIPLMLENLMGYSAQLAGLFMAPRAIASMFAMMLSSALIKRFDIRKILFASIIITVYGTYLMSHYTLEADFYSMMMPTIISGFGMGLFFVPLATVSLSTLGEKEAAEGAGLFNFGRSIGGSIGISLISTLIARESQTAWNRLSGQISATNPNFSHWIKIQQLTHHSPNMGALVTTIAKQASMISFIDAYYAFAILMLLLLPLIFLIKPTKLKHGASALH